MSLRIERRRWAVAMLALAAGVAHATGDEPTAASPMATPTEAPAEARAAVPSPASTTPAPPHPAAAAEACNEPLCYTASRLDAEPNRIVLHDIDIVDTTRGLTHIRADLAEATGLDLGNSQWVLTGHVRVDMPQGQLQSERATVTFVNKHIASMTANGSPAEFERAPGAGGDGPLPPGAEAPHGHARQIIFDMERNELQLSGEGWLSDGCRDITSPHITYDIASQRVQADAASGVIRSSDAQSRCGSQAAHP